MKYKKYSWAKALIILPDEQPQPIPNLAWSNSKHIVSVVIAVVRQKVSIPCNVENLCRIHERLPLMSLIIGTDNNMISKANHHSKRNNLCQG
jgi:hypothetical protein